MKKRSQSHRARGSESLWSLEPQGFPATAKTSPKPWDLEIWRHRILARMNSCHQYRHRETSNSRRHHHRPQQLFHWRPSRCSRRPRDPSQSGSRGRLSTHNPSPTLHGICWRRGSRARSPPRGRQTLYQASIQLWERRFLLRWSVEPPSTSPSPSHPRRPRCLEW